MTTTQPHTRAQAHPHDEWLISRHARENLELAGLLRALADELTGGDRLLSRRPRSAQVRRLRVSSDVFSQAGWNQTLASLLLSRLAVPDLPAPEDEEAASWLQQYAGSVEAFHWIVDPGRVSPDERAAVLRALSPRGGLPPKRVDVEARLRQLLEQAGRQLDVVFAEADVLRLLGMWKARMDEADAGRRDDARADREAVSAAAVDALEAAGLRAPHLTVIEEPA